MLGRGFERAGREIRINVDGTDIDALDGETLAASFAASGRAAYGEANDSSRRGPYCGMGVCHDCLVTIDGGPARRACLEKVRAGMQVRTLGYRIPVPDTRVTHGPAPDLPALDCDVLVVGAGPAGLAAAEQLALAGLDTVIADERPEAGGQYFKPLASTHRFAFDRPADRQYAQGQALIRRVRDAGVRLHHETVIWSASRTSAERLDVGALVAGSEWSLRPRALVLATGAFERAWPFPGWTLPGVTTTGAAQGLARAYRVAPGERVLVAGNGPLNLQLASELVRSGVEVVAVAELAPRVWLGRIPAAVRAAMNSPALVWQGLQYLHSLRRAGTPLLNAHAVTRAEGSQRVECVSVAALDDDGQPRAGTERRFDVDALCLGYGFLPSNALARLLGCEHRSTAPGVLAPVRDEAGATSVPGVYVIGDASAIGGAHTALAEGRLAAVAVVRELTSEASASTPASRNSRAKLAATRRTARRHKRFQSALWSLYGAPSPGLAFADEMTMLCRCECVSRGTLEALVRDGMADLGSLKRATRAGMGRCQGRYCSPLLADLLASEGTEASEPTALFMPQRPLLPVPAGALAREQPEWQGYRTVTLPTPRPGAASRGADLDVDVLIIGGGIIGISTAYFAARRGLDVCVLDRGHINGQASGGNAGTLHLQLLSFEFSDEPRDSIAPAVRAIPLHRDGIALWRSLQQELGADFEIGISGGIMVAESDADLEFLQAKTHAELTQGVAAELLSRAELRERVPGISAHMVGAALCPGEGKINPLHATTSLLGAACGAGARVLACEPVTAIRRNDAGFAVATPTRTIRCRRIVNAAGAWAADIARLAGIELPVHSAPQQMIVTEPVAPMLNQVLAHAHRHLTMKQAGNGNLIIGGGWFAGHDDEQMRPTTEHDGIRGNLWAACAVLPAVANVNVIRSWAALGVAIDGAPIVGETPGHAGIVHAVGANGYTLGPIIGRAVASQLATGRTATEVAPFSPARFGIHGAVEQHEQE